MMRFIRYSLPVCLALVAFPCGMCRAEEPVSRFLEGLREKGYYDVAVDYIEWAEKSPLTPKELKVTLPYEKGVTLVRGANAQRDASLRAKQLNEAQDLLRNFISTQATHPLASGAKSQLGNLLVERARMNIERAGKPAGAAQKTELLKEARGFYDEAYKVFTDNLAEIRGKLEKIPKILDPKKDAEQIELRDQLRKDYLYLQLLSAAVLEETADTEAEGSKGRTDLLTKAAAEYGEIYEKYRTLSAGLYARMYQGRCTQNLGKHKEALSFFQDLIDQPDQPQVFRTIKTKTMLLAMKSWNAEKQYAAAALTAGEWVNKARPDEYRDPEMVELQMELAKAYVELGKQLAKDKPADARSAEKEARKILDRITRFPSDFQQDARKLLASMGGREIEEEKKEPKTFEEAKIAGKEALDQMQTDGFVLKQVPARIAKEKDPTVKAELQKQVDAAKKRISTGKEDAKRYFELALKLQDEDTSDTDVNVVRYFLCYLNYTESEFYEAALLGEFVSRRYPDGPGARDCAKIAMASYLKLYKSSPTEDKSFETGKVIDVADYIVSKWPTQPEAADALNTLIPFMIQAGELDKAQQYLAKIPNDSPLRGSAELKTGQALASSYLTGMNAYRKAELDGKKSLEELAADRARLEKLKTQAQKTMEGGIARMKESGEDDPMLAPALLMLSQIYVDTEQTEKALGVLEDKTVGLLAMVDKKVPATTTAGFAEEAYKVALRARIASLPTAKDPDSTIAAAKSAMEKLKEVAKDQTQLVKIYVSLAKDLETQITNAEGASKMALSKGFETFLKQVGSESQDINTRNWVAETFYNMGTSFDTTGPLNPQAKKYYTEAHTMYEKLLGSVKGSSEEDTRLKTQLQLRLASTNKALGNFDAAMDAYEKILKENNMLLTVQVDAAYTYQEWAEEGEPVLYDRAIKGGRTDAKTRKYTIWGWGKIANLTSRDARFREIFHEARYNLAKARFKQALRQTSKQEKARLLQLAKNDVSLTNSLYPDLGGPQWREKYDDLFKEIQGELKEKPVGLAALDKKPEKSSN